MDLLEEDHRDAGAPARLGDGHDAVDTVRVPRHVGDAGDLEGLEAALLHVDDDEGRLADDQLPHASSSYPAPCGAPRALTRRLAGRLGLVLTFISMEAEKRGGPGRTCVGLPGFYPSV